ncbi:MAG: nucleoside phosphorylase [Thermodesulfobacteriota bacterium]|nr:nucleoside phosphorylase [Thermodesulfobacteriota bacterium]
MNKHDAIVNPATGKSALNLGSNAVMVSSDSDLQILCGMMNLKKERFKKLLMSRLYIDGGDKTNVTLTGPFIGAPYTVMLLETLIAWGARKILFSGWCGAISCDVMIGDIIIPDGAIIDEGTSKHYGKVDGSLVRSSGNISESIKEALRKKGLSFHEGVIWSTDAVYRETPEKVEHFQKKDALAVEMELSALFTVGSFREVEVGAVLVVSDEISTYNQVAGFSKQCFRKSRRAVCKTISSMCFEKTV